MYTINNSKQWDLKWLCHWAKGAINSNLLLWVPGTICLFYSAKSYNTVEEECSSPSFPLGPEASF